VTGNSQPGFTKDKSCFTRLVVLYDKLAGLVDVGRAADVESSMWQVCLT